MKKEYLILIVLILLLGAYVFFHKENRDNYTLPMIEPVNTADITGIVLKTGKDTITFQHREKDWTLTENNYPADSASVQNMLDVFKSLKLTALVSEKGDVKRYDLDEENRIRVTALKDKEAVFEMTVGKIAPTFNHTFVMIKEDPNVYHASGSFRADFDKTVADFRDKTVLSFKKASVVEMKIEKDGITRTIAVQKTPPPESAAGEPDKNPSDKREDTITWTDESGALVDSRTVSDLLSSVSFLECDSYLTAPEKNGLEKEAPLCKIDLKTDKDLMLTLFETGEDKGLSGISSMSDYGFVLTGFTGREIVSNVDALLGITKAEEKKE